MPTLKKKTPAWTPAEWESLAAKCCRASDDLSRFLRDLPRSKGLHADAVSDWSKAWKAWSDAVTPLAKLHMRSGPDPLGLPLLLWYGTDVFSPFREANRRLGIERRDAIVARERWSEIMAESQAIRWEMWLIRNELAESPPNRTTAENAIRRIERARAAFDTTMGWVEAMIFAQHPDWWSPQEWEDSPYGSDEACRVAKTEARRRLGLARIPHPAES
jgi:hypothetical protein